MVCVTFSLITFLVLIVWRFVFAGLRGGPLMREMAASQQRENNLLDRVGMAVIACDRFENGSHGVDDPFEREDRAKTYLRRIVALTGAKQMDNGYLLDVGTIQFLVRDRYVRRLRDVTDPEWAYEETCFYSTHKEMPKSEHIATALLQLKKKPALFDRWAAQRGAFKADGQAFGPEQ